MERLRSAFAKLRGVKKAQRSSSERISDNWFKDHVRARNADGAALAYVTPKLMGGFQPGEVPNRQNANAVPLWRYVGWTRGHKKYPRQSKRALARGTA